MTTLLVRPDFSDYLEQLTAPLGLGYLAAVLREAGFPVKIIDLVQLKMSGEEFVNRIAEYGDKIGFIGISVLTGWFPSALKLCKLIKQENRLKHVKIILGGLHPTFLPKYSLEKTGADFVIFGEGELTLPDLIRTLKQKGDLRKVKGIAYFKGNQYIQTEKRELIEDLDSLPYPAWDLLKIDQYDIPLGFVSKNYPVMPIITSRGCPNECTYCSSVQFWTRKVRFHSIKRIVDEIEILINQYHAKEITIFDDNFTLIKKRIWEFARELKRRKINITFHCASGVHVDTLSTRILKVLKTIGFYQLTFAIESASPRILKTIKKRLDLQHAKEMVRDAKKMGYFVRGLFIIGLPGEDFSDIYRSMRYAKELNLDMGNFSIFQPFPGCTIWYDWIKDKKLENLDWNMSLFGNPPDMRGLNKISPKEILQIRTYIYLKTFILRPQSVLKYMINTRPNVLLKSIISRFRIALGLM